MHPTRQRLFSGGRLALFSLCLALALPTAGCSDDAAGQPGDGAVLDATGDGGGNADAGDAGPTPDALGGETAPPDGGGAADAAPQAEAPGLLPNTTLWDPPATAIHVDPENENDPQEDGSLAHPYDSLGDVSWKDNLVVAIRRGTTLNTEAFGVNGNNITLASYGSDTTRPVIHCTSVASGSNKHAIRVDNGTKLVFRDLVIEAPQATSCIRLGGASSDDITLDNLELSGAGWGLRAFSLTKLTVRNTEVHQIKDDGMFIQGVKGIEIAHCYVHDVNQNWKPPYTPQGEAGGDAIQFASCDNWRVRYNLLDRTNSGNKFCFISNNAAQKDGVFEHNHTRGPLTSGDGGSAIYMHDGDGLIVRYNTIEGPAPSMLYSHATNLQIYGNVVKGTSGGITASKSAKVWHNVFYQLPKGVLSGGTIEARNNIFDLKAGATEPFGKISALDESHNLQREGTPSSGSFAGDPLFVDAANGDFRLKAGSPCVDKGQDVGVAEDRLGTTMPQGSAVDIGAFERLP